MIMSAVRLQATVQDFDIPYLERFLKGISATDINFEDKENSENISIEDADKYLSRIVLEKSEIKICVSNHYEDEEELEFTIKAENGKYFTNQDLIFQIQRYLVGKID